RLASALLSLGAILWLDAARAQNNSTDALPERIKNLEEALDFTEQRPEKRINDFLLLQRVSDVGEIDHVRYSGPPSRVTNNPTGQGAGNEIIVAAYTFLPKKFKSEKLPLLVFVHGGVHSDVKPDGDARVVRELIDQGYAIIAPDYRGSTGYGRDY